MLQCCSAAYDRLQLFLLNLLGLAVVSQVDALHPRPSAGEWPKS